MARETPLSKSLLERRPSEAKLNEKIFLKPIAGHHFNLEAPARCGPFSWIDRTPRQLSCQLTSAGTHDVTASICDDAKTFCVLEQFQVTVSDGSAGTQSQFRANEKSLPGRTHLVPKGFLTGELQKAVDEAKSKKQLILIDFFGIWCPPCNMLDELTFSTAAFQTAFRGIVKIKLDVDDPVSFEAKNRWSIGAYPTLVLVNADLEEIDRVVGFRTADELSAWLRLSRKQVPIERILAKKRRTPSERLRLARWSFEKGEVETALLTLKDLRDKPSQALRRKIAWKQVSQTGKPSEQKTALEDLLKGNPDPYEAIDWVAALHEIDPPAGKAWYKKSLSRWSAIQKKEKLSPRKAWWMFALAQAREALGETTAAQEAYRKTALLFEAVEKQGKDPLPRGTVQERAYAHYKGGDFSKARALYEKLTVDFPEEFTFYYGYAATLVEMRDFETAKKYAEVAERFSYGDNYLRARMLRAKIATKLEDRSTARKILTETIEQTPLPNQAGIRTHRYFKQLRDQLAALETDS